MMSPVTGQSSWPRSEVVMRAGAPAGAAPAAAPRRQSGPGAEQVVALLRDAVPQGRHLANQLAVLTAHEIEVLVARQELAERLGGEERLGREQRSEIGREH